MAKILLSRGHYALVDDQDLGWLSQWKWHVSGTGYAVRTIDRKHKVYMHRQINETPDNKFTDHINGNRLDNRRINLRTCYRSGNAMNQQRPKGESGLVGVYRSGGKWRVRVKMNGSTRGLGTYVDPFEASRVRSEFVSQYVGAGN